MNDRKPMQLRLPVDLKAWIAAQATQNASSQNSEIVRAVRERMDREQAASVLLHPLFSPFCWLITFSFASKPPNPSQIE